MKKLYRSGSKTGICRAVMGDALLKYNDVFDLVIIKENQTIQVHIQLIEKGWVAETRRE